MKKKFALFNCLGLPKSLWKSSLILSILSSALLLAACSTPAEPTIVRETVVSEIEVPVTVEVPATVEVPVEVTVVKEVPIEVTVVKEVEVEVTPTPEIIEEVEAEEVVVPVPSFIAETSPLAEEKGIATTFPFDEATVESSLSLVGWWFSFDKTFIFEEDGTWGNYIGMLVVKEEAQALYDGGTYTFEDDTLVLTDTPGTECGAGSATYKVEWLESGGFNLDPITDDCVDRYNFYANNGPPHIPLPSRPLLSSIGEFEPMGETRTIRSIINIKIGLETTSMAHANQVVTNWVFIFNEPELCEAGPFQCGLADLGSNRAAQGDFILARDGGILVGEDGVVLLETSLTQRDSELKRSGLLSLPGGCPVGYPDCGSPVGLTNIDGALIYLAVRSHGPALEGEALESQMTSLYGGCDRELGSGLLGFAVEPAENPDEPSECAFIAFAQHEPNQ